MRVQLDAAELTLALRQVRLEMMAVGDDDCVEVSTFRAAERHEIAALRGGLDALDRGAKADVTSELEALREPSQVTRDLRVARVVGVARWHRMVAELHALARRIDVKRAIRAAAAVRVL